MANPFEASVTIEGDRALERKLARVRDFHPRYSDNVIGAHARKEAERLRNTPYPPMLPNQKYIRTGELGRQFHYFRPAPGVHGVKNTRKNAVWVIWRGMQNRQWHLGRWWTFQGQIEDKLPDLLKELERKADELLRRN